MSKISAPLLCRTDAPAERGSLRYAVTRPAGECTLNGHEYLCDRDGKPLLFGSVWDAFCFLKSHGHTLDSIDAEGIKIVILKWGLDHEEQ